MSVGIPIGRGALWRRRSAVAAIASLACGRRASGSEPIRFGLTPVFVNSDLQLLSRLHDYLVAAIGSPVELVHRRTYQEISALLLSDQIDAAWICGFPYVRWRGRLSLVGVPVYLGRPLYQSYIIVGRDRSVAGFEDLKGDIHAFSDPDSNSGWLVTRHLLLEHGTTPSGFFSRTFFTYGHRNVVRAVAAGLAQSGSVDGYVWNVLSSREPALTYGTRILRRSQWLGFPPVATTTSRRGTAEVGAIRNALLTMPASEQGRAMLKMLELDAFTPGEPGLYRSHRPHASRRRGSVVMLGALNPRTWRISVRVPLLVAVLVLVAVLSVSKLLLDKLAREQDAQLAALGETYLDGLSSALLPAVIRRDIWETFDALDRAKSLYTGLDTNWVAVLLPNATVLAASNPTRFPVGSHLALEINANPFAAPLVVDGQTETAWLSRRLRQDGADVGWVIAQINISAKLAEWREAFWTLVGIDLALALTFSILGWLLVFRMLAPVRLLTDHIAATTELPTPVPSASSRGLSGEFKTLFAKFNIMIDAMQEREGLLIRLANEERLALLGRLASGMAHEVNNPLGGMLTAADTIDTHGESVLARSEALGFIRRGLEDIRNVVRASLVLCKEGISCQPMSPRDLDDLRYLAAPEARRRRVAITWENRLAHSVSADATSVRQVVLNLLLNAVAASPIQGTVLVAVDFQNGTLEVRVMDQGPGLPEHIAALIDTESVADSPRRRTRPLDCRISDASNGRCNSTPASISRNLPCPNAAMRGGPGCCGRRLTSEAGA